MKGKYIVPLILASVSATTFGAHAQFSVKADYDKTTALSGDLIKISGFKGEGEIGKPITLPTAVTTSSTNGENVKVTVLDPRGKEVSLTGLQFTPTLKGYYTVKYTAVVDGKIETATEELKILVQGDDYAIALPDNSQYVIPATVKTNTEILIPLPSVTVNGEDLTTSEIESGLTVTVQNKDNASSKTVLKASTENAYDSTNKTYKFTPSQAGVYELVYRYYDATGTVQDYKTDSFVVKDNFSADDIELSFSYKSSKPTTAVLGNKTTLPKVKVFDKNNSSVELDAYVTITVKNVETGNSYTVEDYEFTPMDKGSYEVTYKAEIPLYGKSTLTNTFRIENVKDNEKPVWVVSNNYTLKEDGKTVKTVYRDIDKDGVYTAGTDVELFNADDTANEGLTEEELQEKIKKAMGDATYNIPSVVYLKSDGTGSAKATIKIPAVYATDNYSSYDKLTFTRSVKSKTGLITEIKKTLADGTKVAYDANSWAEWTFTAEGDYTIRYEVSDENGNSYTEGYAVKVLSSDATLKDEDGKYKLPTLTFPAFASYAKNTSTLTINAPTASDEFDSTVETRLYYSFDKDSFELTNEIYDTNDDGQFVLNLSTVANIKDKDKIYIHAVAYNDYATEYTKVTREVQLIKTSDANPAVFESESTFMADLGEANGHETTSIDQYGMIGDKPAFNQKDVVYLPDYVISDVEDTNLNISLTVKDPYGKTVTVKNSSYVKSVQYNTSNVIEKNIYTIKNGSFIADYSGVYTITYTAKDAGGNIVSKTYGVRVKDTEKPTIVLSSYAPFTESVEVGKFIDIPAATLTDKGVTLTNITTNVPYESRIDGVAGTYWELVEGPSLNTMGTVGFTPTVAGNYVIKYYGWDEEGNYTESKQYTITATDTIKPTIKLEKDYILEKVEWDEDGVVEVYAPGVIELYDGYRDSKNSENDFDQTDVNDITLVVKVYDKNNNLVDGVEAVDHKVVVDGEGNETKEYFEISNGVYATRYKFVAESQGVYTIKYIATDAAGNSTEETLTVNVGDTVAPVVEWFDADEDFTSTAKIGDTYEFNLDMISIDDIKGSTSIEVPSGQEKAEYKITVNMYDSSSSLVTNIYKNDDSKKNSYKWEFEKSGTYELRIVAEDAAGNKTTKSMNIVVSADETEEKTVSSVVGTVLIIVSAVILAGVVIYFVVTSKSKTTTKKGPKSKK